ncbi:MAG: carbohydrate binding family 9 protein [Ferruginibacter sp.]|nr:carbohydrate binding family 9 protein [Ferruginibacter sp.]
MNFLRIKGVFLCLLFYATTSAQVEKRSIDIKRTTDKIKIDGLLDDAAWKNAPVANKFTSLRPTPFLLESPDNASEVFFLYDNDGIYVGGYFHEKFKDSIAAELSGRDGMGNNDFAGIIFDTYNDKLNGFEYFVTPLGEQWDAKSSNSNEDFSWNAVWQSSAKMHNDGWSFEMFLPYSCIRFGKKNIQDWGMNIVRKRQKSGQQLFWQSIDPNKNGFLTQSGLIKGFENIKPPLRLQFSPYLSTYLNHDGSAIATDKTKTLVNGGMDVKYGINQAFTLDMTLVPDFGQVQTDNRVLNLSPFELRFAENRTFFTEGTELFNKGNLFYSRNIGRVGGKPLHYYEAGDDVKQGERLDKNPDQIKLLNATKISGRTQKGLGIGVLNAITKIQYANIYDSSSGSLRKFETEPLTNYSVFVLDQTLKHNSSVSLVNTNVLRSGKEYDANVTSALFDLFDKKNTYNVGGNISISNLVGKYGKGTTTGYAHNLYIGKASGRFGFSLYQDLYNDKYDKSDLGFFTNNNYMEEGIWMGYNWLKPKKWHNQMRINVNAWHNRLVTAIDPLKRKEFMLQNVGGNINGNAQTKKLWYLGFNFSVNGKSNDYYEPRHYGRFFTNSGNAALNLWYEGNSAKKLSFSASLYNKLGGVFNAHTAEYFGSAKLRFSKKFSIDNSVDVYDIRNQAGWASEKNDTTIFSRRNVKSVENTLNFKYNFSNKMGLTFRVRHYWSKVDPQQFYALNENGKLVTPSSPFTGNVNQNYNFMSADMVYNWQFAQGSFFSIVWKDIADDFDRHFERNYIKNFSKTIKGDQFNSLSVRVIYFIDYLTTKKNLKKKSI